MYAKHYNDWCERTGVRSLVVPSGILRIGNINYREDGFIWVGKGRKAKRGERYLVLENYGGVNMVVKFDHRMDIHRFEALRWQILLMIQRLMKRQKAVRAALISFTGGNTAVGLYQDMWYELSFTKEYGYDCVSKKNVDVESLGPLDKMVTLVRDKKELQLVETYMMLDELLGKYWTKLHEISDCMGYIFRKIHPHKDYPWGRPSVEFIINGRSYVVQEATINNRTDSYKGWPSPMRETVNLDI